MYLIVLYQMYQTILFSELILKTVCIRVNSNVLAICQLVNEIYYIQREQFTLDVVLEAS